MQFLKSNRDDINKINHIKAENNLLQERMVSLQVQVSTLQVFSSIVIIVERYACPLFFKTKIKNLCMWVAWLFWKKFLNVSRRRKTSMG